METPPGTCRGFRAPRVTSRGRGAPPSAVPRARLPVLPCPATQAARARARAWPSERWSKPHQDLARIRNIVGAEAELDSDRGHRDAEADPLEPVGARSSERAAERAHV